MKQPTPTPGTKDQRPQAQAKKAALSEALRKNLQRRKAASGPKGRKD